MRDDALDEMRRQVQQSLIAAKRKQIDDEFGIVASGGSGPLPPEVELAWLDNIREFERQFAAGKTTTVRRRLGPPDPPLPEALGAGEVSDALQTLLERLSGCDVAVDFLGDWDEWSAYRHLVEELLDYEIDDIRIEGLVTCFTPTTPAVEAAWVVDFYVSALFSRERDYLLDVYRRQAEEGAPTDPHAAKDYVARLDQLWSLLTASRPDQIDVHEIEISGESARASAEVSWREAGQQHVVVASFTLQRAGETDWQVAGASLLDEMEVLYGC